MTAKKLLMGVPAVFLAASLIRLTAADLPLRDAPSLHARISTELNRKELNQHAVEVSELTREVKQFYEQHKKFTLAQFEAIKVTSTDGHEMTLKDVATFDVSFESDVPTSERK